jgi:hypothetical protein
MKRGAERVFVTKPAPEAELIRVEVRILILRQGLGACVQKGAHLVLVEKLPIEIREWDQSAWSHAEHEGSSTHRLTNVYRLLQDGWQACDRRVVR